MRVAIAGGNGFIGRELTSQLVDAGHEVVWLSHRPGRRPVPTGVTEVPFTYDDPNAPWATETRMADAVVNLSGYPIASYWTGRRLAKLRTSRVETTNALVKQIAATARTIRPRVFVSASAVGIYGESRERVLTEGSPLGDDFLATLALDWEEAARVAEEFDCRVVRIRNGIVLGREGMLPRMLLPTQLFMGGPIGDGRQWVSWVHVADIAALYRFALENSNVIGALNACAPAPVRMGILSAEIGRVIHRPSWLRIPATTLELFMGDVARYTVMSERMSADKALSLGFEFRFPRLHDALQDLIGKPHPAEKPAPAAAVAAAAVDAAPVAEALPAPDAPAAEAAQVQEAIVAEAAPNHNAGAEAGPDSSEPTAAASGATVDVVDETLAEEEVAAESETAAAGMLAEAETVVADVPPESETVVAEAPEEADAVATEAPNDVEGAAQEEPVTEADAVEPGGEEADAESGDDLAKPIDLSGEAIAAAVAESFAETDLPGTQSEVEVFGDESASQLDAVPEPDAAAASGSSRDAETQPDVSAAEHPEPVADSEAPDGVEISRQPELRGAAS